jgi:type I restriction enzyme R subunit
MEGRGKLPERGDLDAELIQDFNQGYEYLPGLNRLMQCLPMSAQLQTLNNVQFSGEWLRFVETWLDKPSDGIVETASSR